VTNVFDYLKWRGDLSFSQDPPNAVDALIFSALAYIRFGDSVGTDGASPVYLRDAAKVICMQEDTASIVRVKEDLLLLKEAAQSRRFGFCRLCFFREVYIPEEDTQFAAVAFLMDDGSAFLAFRGTDYSLAGWKEDFNMSFQQTVPAQRLALLLLQDFSAEFILPLRLGGHSKGGNLAVFAASRCSPMLQRRILEVYINDGPGFNDYLMGDPGYLAMVSRIKTYVPQSSVIGMLLEHEEPYTVIRSSQVSLLQHELYSWEVVGKQFVPMEEITADSRFINLTIKNWIADMSNQERSQLVDSLFDLLSSGDVDSALDIFHPKNLHHYFRTLTGNDDIRRRFFTEIQSIITAAKKAKEQFAEKTAIPASE